MEQPRVTNNWKKSKCLYKINYTSIGPYSDLATTQILPLIQLALHVHLQNALVTPKLVTI